MAREVVLQPSQARAKIRSPWGVLGLALVTFGIYTIVWWFSINRELRDLGRARGAAGLGDSPASSAVAVSLGALVIVPYIVTVVGTLGRIKRAQGVVGLGENEQLNGGIAAAVWILTFGLGGLVFAQSQINRVWTADAVQAAQAGAVPAPAPVG